MAPDDGRVVSNFIVQALRNDPITIHGDGTQTRSFCYVDDLVEGLIRLMNSDVAVPVNLGNPGEFTLLELASMVYDKIPDTRSIMVYKDLPGDDPKQRKPDISRAKKLLNWEPKVSLSEGLDKTIEYFNYKCS
jgi:UDP-glucuronate decarboxylase